MWKTRVKMASKPPPLSSSQCHFQRHLMIRLKRVYKFNPKSVAADCTHTYSDGFYIMK